MHLVNNNGRPLFWQHDTLNHVKRTENSFSISFLFSFLFFFYYFFGFCTTIFTSILCCTHPTIPWTHKIDEKTENSRVKRQYDRSAFFFFVLLCAGYQCCLLSLLCVDGVLHVNKQQRKRRRKKKSPVSPQCKCDHSSVAALMRMHSNCEWPILRWRNRRKCAAAAASWIDWAFNYSIAICVSALQCRNKGEAIQNIFFNV